MRIFLPIVALLALACSGLSAQTLDGNPEHVVRAMLGSKDTGASYSGIQDKQLSRMGDAACVALTKIVAGRKLSPGEIDRVLLIIHLSFGAPQIVQNKEDWEPRTALFVLNYLELTTKDPKQLEAIRETRSYVRHQYQKAMHTDQSSR